MSRRQDIKNVFLKTFGCQMNVYDTELVRTILTDAGFVFVDDALAADVVMLNTCAVRENAHRRIFGHLQAFHHRRRLRGAEGRPLVGILGCMATNLRRDLLEDRRLGIDFIAGPDSYRRLPELIRRAAETGEKTYDLTLSEFETYADVYPSRASGVNAWIAVMRGCNNFCTFCVVPYTRGRERSRSLEDVVAEAGRLTAEGFLQVTLLGQNVNSYHHDGRDFADLLGALSEVDGLRRIRFTSPHPKDFPMRLLDQIAADPKLCKHIHLPLQAGSDRVLERMARGYTAADFLGLIGRIRRRIPEAVLTTDIIVGFPGETEEDFRATERVMEEVGFDAAFIFKYSPREHTIAARRYPDDVPVEAKTERIVRLNDLQQGISLTRNRARIGRVEEVLVERDATARSDVQRQGRTDGNIPVILDAEGLRVGDLLPVRIIDATPHVLRGEPLSVCGGRDMPSSQS